MGTFAEDAARTAQANELYAQGRIREACAIYREVYEHQSDLAMAMLNYGVALVHLGEFDEAFPLIEKAFQIRPNDRRFRHAYSEALQREGRWLEAWQYWSPLVENPFTGGGAHWNGESLFGKEVLVVPAGGYGDIFMLSRYIPEVAKRFHCRVSFAPIDNLVPVFLRQPSMIGVNLTQRRNWEVWLHLFQFPQLFQMTPETVLWNGPYIESIPMKPTQKLRIGVRLGAEEKGDAYRFRSVPAKLGQEFLAALEGPEVEMHALTLSNPEIDNWIDTIAFISDCDLVISVDTAVLHLAAAMGKPTWAILGDFNDAKWGRSETTPWYPTMKIFRGEGHGYEHTLEQITSAFGDWLTKETYVATL